MPCLYIGYIYSLPAAQGLTYQQLQTQHCALKILCSDLVMSTMLGSVCFTRLCYRSR